jgi:alpha-ribazole phosphatase
MDYSCDFGEGFEVIVTASMWQRSEAFEVLCTYPAGEEIEQYSFSSTDPDEE